MANRNKAKKAQKATPGSSKPTSVDNIGRALASVDNLVEGDNTSLFGGIAEKLKLAKSSYEAADQEKRIREAASLDIDIQSLIGELRRSIENSKQLESDNSQSLSRSKQLEVNVEQLKTKIESEKKELDKNLKAQAIDVNKVATDKADIAQRLSNIKEQELDAENGFAMKHLEMLEKFETDKEKLLVTQQNKKLKLELQIKDLTTSRDSLSEEETSLLDLRLSELSIKEDDLTDREFKLTQKSTLIERKLIQSQLSNDEASRYKTSLREEVKTEYLHQMSSLETIKNNLEQQITKYQGSENQYLAQLSAFNDISRQFGDSTAQQVLEQLSSYKAKITDLKLQLEDKPSDQLDAQYKELRKTNEALEQEYKNAQAELQKNKILLSKNLMSVIELEQVEKQKQAYIKHNELLKGALDQLRADVDDLVDKQQSKTAFPALLELDSKLRANGVTEDIPSLDIFAQGLQQRIAWDAKENKSLYYRLEDIHLFIAGLSMSRLHILQGISGTGKTSLAKAFARAVGGGCKTISVQAGWRDKGDLVGHFNAFEKKFYEQETLQGLYEAQCPLFSDRPYIILLDEMNLSRPEQYFAEFLSALELDPKDRVLTLMTTGNSNGPELLIDGRKIKIPENVWFIGTANHDETTFEFADKTYDRAHVMELPRHKNSFVLNKNLDPITYSFSSLEAAFESASRKHLDKVSQLVKAIDNSMFSEYLEQDFNVSWGNRFERHLNRFIPVMLECGSDLGFALDHMLATKVLRAGKATGRYDTEAEDISNLIDALKDFWKDQKFIKAPTACLKLLENELKKKSNN